MNESISAPFIRYPIATSLLMAGILFVGLVAYPLLPVAPLPQVDFPTIQVAAQLPARSPETMASSVAQPLERQFGANSRRRADDVDQLARARRAITVQFDLNRNIDGAANDIQAAINAAGGQLPKNLPSPPTYRKVNPADSPILSALGDLGHGAADRVERRRRCTILAQQISQISGVAQVIIGGQQKPAIRIQIDPGEAGASRACRWRTSRNQIAITTVDSPKGNIDGADPQLHDLRQRSAAECRRTGTTSSSPIATARPLRIRDIGRAVTGPEDVKQAAWADGKRGVFLVIFKQPGANVIDTVDRIKAAVAKADCGDSARHQDQDHQRSYPDHPRRRRRRSIHVAGHHRARRDGDLHLPAQRLGNDNPERHGAAGVASARVR